VRTLFGGAAFAGAHRAGWDGRSSAGAPVESGIYFARLQFGSTSAVQRIAFLK